MNLAILHEQAYPDINQYERLDILGMTSQGFSYSCKSVRERLDRESSIPDEDILALIKQIINHPFLGGAKGALKLLEDQKAYIGSTTYTEVKALLRKAVEEEYFNRRRESELKKNFQKRIDYKKPFEKPQVVKPNEVWSIDFTFVSILGFKFAICEIYDIYSQTYYAMEVGETPDEQLAKKAFLIALRNSQAVPLRCILSDNDSSFLGEEFQELLKSQKVEHKTIPPGSPWYNGEIESGNRDLKKALLTKALQETCKNVEITLKGSSREVVETFVKKKCNETRILLNEDIPRMKFKTTPQKVLEGKVEEQQEKQRKFIEMKKNQRKQRMDKLKTGVIKSKVKTLVEKVKMLWKKEVKDMSNDEIYVLNETINERYNAIIA